MRHVRALITLLAAWALLLVCGAEDFTSAKGSTQIMSRQLLISSPTYSPSRQPSAIPTARDTSPPSAIPTARDTSPPSTAEPTRQPTAQPTDAPTRPTPLPTFAPSYRNGEPTPQPTVAPSAIPSERPSSTSSPTRPTAIPTPLPSRTPSPEPSAAPTMQPTLTTYEQITMIMNNVRLSLFTDDNLVLDSVSRALAVALNSSVSYVGPTVCVRVSRAPTSAPLSLRRRRLQAASPTPRPTSHTFAVSLSTLITTTSTNTGGASVQTQGDAVAAALITTLTQNLPLFLSTFKSTCRAVFLSTSPPRLADVLEVQMASVSALSLSAQGLYPTMQPTSSMPTPAPTNLFQEGLGMLEANHQLAIILGASMGGAVVLIVMIIAFLYRKTCCSCCFAMCKSKAQKQAEAEAKKKAAEAEAKKGCCRRILSCLFCLFCCGCCCRKKAPASTPLAAKDGKKQEEEDDDDDDEDVSSSDEEEDNGAGDGEEDDDDEDDENPEGTGLALQQRPSATASPFHAATSASEFSRRASMGDVAKAKTNPLLGPSSPVRSSITAK